MNTHDTSNNNLIVPGKSVNRREFGRVAAASSVLAAVASITLPKAADAQSGVTDVDVLNFALNLEYLEAEFYTVVTTGRRIADLGIGVGGVGTAGPTTGGAVVALDEKVNQAALNLANEEQMHVRFLRNALGSAAAAKPAINLEALGIGFRNQTEFLILARAFEDVGLTAYLGAAPLLQSKGILAAAAAIALTEAQHAGLLRFFVYDRNIAVPQLDSLDVPPLGSPNGRLFNVFNEGLPPSRSTSEVLSIVYGSKTAGATSGAFYPGGMNGRIRAI